jgi:hypothetical protein
MWYQVEEMQHGANLGARPAVDVREDVVEGSTSQIRQYLLECKMSNY